MGDMKGVIHMLTILKAEREADRPLHVLAGKGMLVMFFAAGHYNYARYGDARGIGAMPAKLQDQFMKGQHTMHHKPGIKCSCKGEKPHRDSAAAVQA